MSFAQFEAIWHAQPSVAELREDARVWLRRVQWAAEKLPRGERIKARRFVQREADEPMQRACVLEALGFGLAATTLVALARRLPGDDRVPIAELLTARGDEMAATRILRPTLGRGEGAAAVCIAAGRLAAAARDDASARRRWSGAFAQRLRACEGDDFHASQQWVRALMGARAGEHERLAWGLRSGWVFLRARAHRVCEALTRDPSSAAGGWWARDGAEVGAQARQLVSDIDGHLPKRARDDGAGGRQLGKSIEARVLALDPLGRERIEGQLLSIYGAAMRRWARRRALDPAARNRMRATQDPLPGGLGLLAGLDTPRTRTALHELATTGPRSLRTQAKGLAPPHGDDDEPWL